MGGRGGAGTTLEGIISRLIQGKEGGTQVLAVLAPSSQNSRIQYNDPRRGGGSGQARLASGTVGKFVLTSYVDEFVTVLALCAVSKFVCQ
jgi:hypothetical protein